MVHLPAVNTPQFTWARTHIDRQPMPLPPVHQPEAIAEEIVEAAYSRPRELWVGDPTAKAILGTMVAPGRLDAVLSSKAYEGQMTEESIQPDRPDNLFEPLAGDFGSHGKFDQGALETVRSYRPASLRLGLTVAGIVASAGLGALAASFIAKR
jgi:hypothetical protein